MAYGITRIRIAAWQSTEVCVGAAARPSDRGEEVGDWPQPHAARAVRVVPSSGCVSQPPKAAAASARSCTCTHIPPAPAFCPEYRSWVADRGTYNTRLVTGRVPRSKYKKSWHLMKIPDLLINFILMSLCIVQVNKQTKSIEFWRARGEDLRGKRLCLFFISYLTFLLFVEIPEGLRFPPHSGQWPISGLIRKILDVDNPSHGTSDWYRFTITILATGQQHPHKTFVSIILNLN